MMEIIAGLSATKTGLDIVKSVRELLKGDKVDKEAITARLGDLQDLRYQAREALGDAQEESRQLKAELEKRDKWAEIQVDMEYVEDGGYYIRKSEKAAGRNIAYCPLCLKAAQADVPLDPQGGEGNYYCAIHKANFKTKAYLNRLRQHGSSSYRGGGSWMSS